MTPEQRQLANKLIKKSCANYHNGNCLLLDDGETSPCVQSISISVNCNYFRNIVLPLNKQLENGIMNHITRFCEDCKVPFQVATERSRQRLCVDCSKKRIRESQKRNKMEKRRRAKSSR